VALTATAHSTPGTLRQEIVVDGRHRLVTDQPVELGGGGTGPSPHELFPAALAGCVAVTLARYARTKDWELGAIDVDVDYDHKSTPRTFDVVIRLDRELDADQLARLEKVAAACPLRRSIEAGVEFRTRLLPRREPPLEEGDERGNNSVGAEAA
jgi:putative redox protein